ncbi:MAG: class I SAM-dependent methyltransferase [Chloroflexi bacterium]|nr:class I SAM-dependent methyltransferase [Chloroflexota bacterium]
MRHQWNQISATYQARHQITTQDIHYGPWSPSERELHLLGNIQGQRVLELGCGGGQCCISFARKGAYVVGLDVSDAQLTFARALAAREKVTVEFIQGSAECLTQWPEGSWDLVFSIYTFQYIEQIEHCLAECYRVLRPGGQLIFSLDHPLRACFFDAEDDELALYPVRSYFDNAPLSWIFPETQVMLQARHYTIAQWLDLLQAQGFRLQRLVEPPPPAALLDEFWPLDSAYASLRHIPQTIIFVAIKT